MKDKQKRVLYTLFVIAAALVIAFFRSSRGSVSLAVDDTSLTVKAPSGWSFTVPIENILSVSVQRLVDYGKMLDGEKNKDFSCGSWKNERWGQYTLCVDNAVPVCVAIITYKNVYVINYQNVASTENLAKAIEKASKGE